MRSQRTHSMITEGPFDIGIIIALPEEFRLFHPQLRPSIPKKDDATGHHDYFFTRRSSANHLYQCVATCIGDMGPEKAAVATEQFIQRRHPRTIVMLGIGGGIDDDVRLGDVVVGRYVDNYLTRAKAVDSETGGFTFESAGIPFHCSQDLVKCVVDFEFAHGDLFIRWQKLGAKDLTSRVASDKRRKLKRADLIRPIPAVEAGPIASGPPVGASQQFKAFLKSINRTYLMLETEGGAFLTAVCSHASPSATMLLRGVSDFADERKKSLDRIGKRGLRAYAMNNATQLLWLLLDADLLPRCNQSPLVPSEFRLLRVVEGKSIVIQESEDSPPVTLPWQIPHLDVEYGERAAENVRDWKRLHKLAETALRSFSGLQEEMIKCRTSPKSKGREAARELVANYIDGEKNRFEEFCTQVRKLPKAVRDAHPVVMTASVRQCFGVLRRSMVYYEGDPRFEHQLKDALYLVKWIYNWLFECVTRADRMLEDYFDSGTNYENTES